jgi:hypothetical protein
MFFPKESMHNADKPWMTSSIKQLIFWTDIGHIIRVVVNGGNCQCCIAIYIAGIDLLYF